MTKRLLIPIGMSLGIFAGCSAVDTPGEAIGRGPRIESRGTGRVQAGYVDTPVGLVHASCAHQVPSGSRVNVNELGPCNYPIVQSDSAPGAEFDRADGADHNGPFMRSEYTHPAGLAELEATVRVPDPPCASGIPGNKILYTDAAVVTERDAEGWRSQLLPVIRRQNDKYEITPVIWNRGHVVWADYQEVQPGDRIQLHVKGIAPCSGGTCDEGWEVSTTDLDNPSIKAKLTSYDGGTTPRVFQIARVMLEEYRTTTCADFPSDRAVNIKVILKDSSFQKVTPTWINWVYEEMDPLCGFRITEPRPDWLRFAYQP